METLQHLPVPERGCYKTDGKGLFTSAYSDRTRENGFNVKEQIQIRYQNRISYCKGGEKLAQDAQRSCRFSIPGSVQGLLGWWKVWSGGRYPCPCQGAWNQIIYKVPSIHSILPFYNFINYSLPFANKTMSYYGKKKLVNVHEKLPI